MRKFIAIFFLFLLTAQFVQATHFFSGNSSYAYALSEELKENKEEKEDPKEWHQAALIHTGIPVYNLLHFLFVFIERDKPYLAKLSPPPDFSA